MFACESRLTRGVVYFLTVALAGAPLQGLTQEPQQVNPRDFVSMWGREGQEHGQSLGDDAKRYPAKVENGVVTIPQRDDHGGLSYEAGNSFSVQSLFPGTAPGSEGSSAEYFADGQHPSVSDLGQMHDSEYDMGERGNDAAGALWSDAYGPAPSISGAAYRVLVETARMSKPSFTNDPMMKQTKDTYSNIDVIAAGFGDCSVETSFGETDLELRNPEYEVCNRVTNQSQSCEILHDYAAGVIKHHGGPYNLVPCEDEAACSDLWIGRVGNNYWQGDCTIYEEFTEVLVVNPDAISSATLERAKWDDYMQIWIGPPGQEVKAWQGPAHMGNHFPPETGRFSCELDTSWDENPGFDLTPYFKNASAGSVIRFKIRVSVTDKGEGFGRIRLRYDMNKAIYKDEWSASSDTCIEAANAVLDGFASGSVSCVDDPSNDEGCTFIEGLKICPQHLKPSPVSGITSLCRKISVESEYDFYLGQQECFENLQGEWVCPVNEGENLDTCVEMEENPKCGYISSSCLDGAKGRSGTCYVQEERWDCGSTVNLPTVEKQDRFQCSGEIRCMGDDCLDPTRTESQSGNFAKASALLNAAQFMTQDMHCTGLDDDGRPTGEENVTCSAFGGVPGECKVAVGGVSDCCEKPKNVSLADYLSMIRSVPKLDGAILSLKSPNGQLVKSSYQTLRDPLVNTWTEIKQPFTSYMDNVSGVVEELWSPIEELKNQLIDELKERAKAMLQDVMGSLAQDGATEAAATAAADEAAEQAMNKMAEQAASMLGAAMTVYTVYVVAVAVIQMVWACEQEELELNTKRATDSCSHLGSYCKESFLGACIEKVQSYCCYNSPLSRIVQEQARPQLGLGFGTAREPICEGIPFHMIAQIDWDRVNLDEWLAILVENGQFPTQDGITMDALTGSGSVFNLGSGRLPADERAAERIEGIDADAIRRKAMDEIPINPMGSLNPDFSL